MTHTIFNLFPVLKNFCFKNSFGNCKFYKQLLSLLSLVKEFQFLQNHYIESLIGVKSMFNTVKFITYTIPRYYIWMQVESFLSLWTITRQTGIFQTALTNLKIIKRNLQHLTSSRLSMKFVLRMNCLQHKKFYLQIQTSSPFQDKIGPYS